MRTTDIDYCWKICFVIFSVEYLDNPFSGCLSTDWFLSLACVVPQRSGYARFELQVDNIPHREEDTIYGNSLLFEVQYCPDMTDKSVIAYSSVLPLARCAIIGISFPPIPWPMTGTGSSLKQLYPPYTLLGSDCGIRGHLGSQNDVITSWLRLTATSNCFLHLLGTLICCP